MTAEPVDLGHGHTLTWAAWQPDRELNPQYAHLPDIEKCTGIIRHPVGPGGPGCGQDARYEQGYCTSAFSVDSEVARELFAERALWQVSCWESLSLSPSILCMCCGDHGFIQGGLWAPA
jgi:hypothetical protein